MVYIALLLLCTLFLQEYLCCYSAVSIFTCFAVAGQALTVTTQNIEPIAKFITNKITIFYSPVCQMNLLILLIKLMTNLCQLTNVTLLTQCDVALSLSSQMNWKRNPVYFWCYLYPHCYQEVYLLHCYCY